MEILILFIPVIIALVLLLFFRSKTTLWEYCLLIVPSCILYTVIYFGMISYDTSDTEYQGYYVTNIRYYESWNEYIHKTCSRSRRVGKKTVTTYYDCSYVKYHSEYFTKVLNNNSEIEISQKYYNYLKNLWNTHNSFVELNRNYHSKDGDMYECSWDNLVKNCQNVTFENIYENKIKASTSLFSNSLYLKNIEKDKLFLYDYPEIKQNHYQNTILSKHSINLEDKLEWDYLNSFYGKSFQFRSYIFFYYNNDKNIIEEQLTYWKGVNKNEMNIFIGIDTITNKKIWSKVVSWSDKPELEIKIQQYLNSSDSINIKEISNLIKKNISLNWKRKDFKDFDYIEISLTQTQLIILFFVIFIFNIGVSIWVVLNEFTNENNDEKYY